jgi:hypothetical protein
VAGPLRAQPARFTIEQYAGILEVVRDRLEQGQVEEAQSWAQGLRGGKIAFGDETIAADATVLGAVAAVKTPAEARAVAGRVRRLLEALRGPSGETAGADVRPSDLDALRPDADLEKGGRVEAPQLQAPTFPERAAAAILAAYDWVVEVLRKIRDFLARLKPRRAATASGLGETTVAAILGVALAALGLALLAWRTLRRARAAPVEVESLGSVVSNRDDDPLSRETTEWEARARELMAAGRWREAVRAFYHAVLVGLFSSGLLHYQKGRTNWEYAARLSPDLAWRPAFLDLTRLFDREWYGRAQGDPETVRRAAEEARSILRALRAAGETA